MRLFFLKTYRVLFLAVLSLSYFSAYSDNGSSNLIGAIESGDVNRVLREVEEQGTNINEVVDEDGNTPLMTAADGGRVGIARLLLEKGADVNAINQQKETALELASDKGHASMVRLLLEHKAEINTVNEDDYSPLVRAVVEGHTDIVRILLENGADVNAGGENALQSAAAKGFDDIVLMLLENGADVNMVNYHGNTALLSALFTSHQFFGPRRGEAHLGVMEILLENGAEVGEISAQYKDVYGFDDGNSILRALLKKYAGLRRSRSVTSQLVKVVRLLLKNGADASRVGPDGVTQLMHAVNLGNVDIVRLLLDHGADVNATDRQGNTALMYSIKAMRAVNDLEVVHLLLERGADVNVANLAGKTVLIQALENGSPELIQLIAKSGADLDIIISQANPSWVQHPGLTPLMLVAAYNQKVLVRLFLELGARPPTDEEMNVAGLPQGAIDLVNSSLSYYQKHIEEIDRVQKELRDKRDPRLPTDVSNEITQMVFGKFAFKKLLERQRREKLEKRKREESEEDGEDDAEESSQKRRKIQAKKVEEDEISSMEELEKEEGDSAEEPPQKKRRTQG